MGIGKIHYQTDTYVPLLLYIVCSGLVMNINYASLK